MAYDLRFHMPSPYAADGGHMIGRLPKDVGAAALAELGHPASPTKAIRAKCLDCAENEAEVRKCTATACPLWPFRMGRNPFHSLAKAADNDEAAE